MNTPQPTPPRIFAQWRPRRPGSSRTDRKIDYSEPLLYVCAYWHRDGKQTGRSYSAEKHGTEGAVRKAAQAIRDATGVRVSVRAALTNLGW